MTDTPDWEMAALEALKAPAFPNARSFKTAWVAALLGFVVILLAFVLNVYYWERWIGYFQGDNYEFDRVRDISRLGAISGYAFGIGTVFMVASIVFVFRGLSIDDDRRRSGTILIGTLERLKWVAMFALVLYLVSAVLRIAFGESWLEFSSYGVMRLMYYPSGAANVFLAALPLIATHALNKSRA